MSKYTNEQLTAMAKSYQWHLQTAPAVCNQFLMFMCAATGFTSNEITKRIEMMANNDFTFENQ